MKEKRKIDPGFKVICISCGVKMRENASELVRRLNNFSIGPTERPE